MPTSERSVLVTQRYQAALANLQGQAALHVRAHWQAVDSANLRETYEPWTAAVAPTIAAAQQAGVTLSAGYLSAYTTSETGEHEAIAPVEAKQYVGQTPAGLPIVDALNGTLFGALKLIKDRDHAVPFAATVAAAMSWALARNMRLAAESAAAASRSSLQAMFEASDRYEGWRRIARPTACVACLASANGQILHVGDPLHIHNHCSCVQQPVVRGVTEKVRQLTGFEQFNNLTAAQQDALAGPDTAKAIRDGSVKFGDLVATNEMAAQPDQIQDLPVGELAHAH